jgi:hypothetical protein
MDDPDALTAEQASRMALTAVNTVESPRAW